MSQKQPQSYVKVKDDKAEKEVVEEEENIASQIFKLIGESIKTNAARFKKIDDKLENVDAKVRNAKGEIERGHGKLTDHIENCARLCSSVTRWCPCRSSAWGRSSSWLSRRSSRPWPAAASATRSRRS